jgi:hypothetical protein
MVVRGAVKASPEDGAAAARSRKRVMSARARRCCPRFAAHSAAIIYRAAIFHGLFDADDAATPLFATLPRTLMMPPPAAVAVAATSDADVARYAASHGCGAAKKRAAPRQRMRVQPRAVNGQRALRDARAALRCKNVDAASAAAMRSITPRFTQCAPVRRVQHAANA